MSSIVNLTTIDAIRAASRKLVRELGFMGGNLAGTNLSPSAVHALIEIEAGAVAAKDLGLRLHLEKSSVSRMLRKLVEAGLVTERAAKDGRVKTLHLAPSGKQRVSAIHAFARKQVGDALGRLEAGQDAVVLDGLNLYASALADDNAAGVESAVDIFQGYQTGLIAQVTQMHADYYSRAAGFGRQFEAVVAGGLAEFCNRIENRKNAVWTAMRGEDIVGAVAIDGEDLGGDVAHLRWFILDDRARGRGLGRALLSAALHFVDDQRFEETHLWTFRGLDAARHLYEAHGFVLSEERPGAQWGRTVQEQRFVRPRKAMR